MAKVQEVIRPDGATVTARPVAGDMRWDGKAWRRWSGRRWEVAAYSLHRDWLRTRTPLVDRPPLGDGSQVKALALAVEHEVSENGAAVVLDGPRGVVLGYRRHVSHVFHAVMTLLTGGLWAVVWLAAALGRRENRVRLEADPWGNVWSTPVASA
jgi:hypothetical protein